MSRHKMFSRAQREVAARMQTACTEDDVRRTYVEDLGQSRASLLPSLARAGIQRQTEVLKSTQMLVWNMAKSVYQPNFAQLVYVGWAFGNSDDWAGTADSYASGQYLKPANTALMYVGFSGQPDFLKPQIPEILAVLVPLCHYEGNLVADCDKILTRSVTCAARGLGSAPPAPYSRQFNYATEGRFMHSAYSAAVQLLAALSGKFDYAARCLGEIGDGLQLPVPQLCQMVRGGPMESPRPVPLSRLRDDQVDPDAFMVLDVNSIPEGIELHGDSVKVVPQTKTWRIAAGHVRAIYHRYGAANDADMRPMVDVCVSVR